MRMMEEVTTTREVEAVVIPAGNRVLIPEGVPVTITQSLGGSYTVVTPQGYMARISATDADALGKKPVAPAGEPKPDQAPADGGELEKQVWDQLRSIFDPEIPINIVDLGLIYKCELTAENGTYRVQVDMTMTAPGCGMGDVLKLEAEEKICALAGIAGCQVEIVWDPPWDQSRMSEAARLELGFG
jgi:probable FeS assembly SUF system protein SufT